MTPLKSLLYGLFGLAIMGGVWYSAFDFLLTLDVLRPYARSLGYLQLGAFALVGFGLLGLLLEYRTTAAARATSARVDDALKAIQQEAPGKSVAEISAHEVVRRVAGPPAGNERLAKLVAQRKQQLLIDDESLADDVKLIVNYLQPLPRNAKRVLNRFRVALLIADRRGLFVSEPRVTREHIGKWLVLGERWPQLRQSLAASPEKIRVLETAPDARPQEFLDTLQALAPFYAGDDELRAFLGSEPPLGPVLRRLVHYEGVQAS